MRRDVREFIRRLEAAGLDVEPTAGHYRVLREGRPLRKAKGDAVQAALLARHDPLAAGGGARAPAPRNRGRAIPARELHARALLMLYRTHFQFPGQ